MKSYTDKKYINIAFVIALLILVFANIIVYLNLKFHFTSEEIINNSFIITQNTETLYSNLLEAETNRRGFLITNNEEFISLYQSAIYDIDSSLVALSKLLSENLSFKKKVDSLEILINQRIAIWEESIELQKNRGVNFRVQKEHVMKGTEITRKIKNIITSIQQFQKDILAQKISTAQTSAHYTLVNLSISSAIAFILLIAGFYFLNRNISLRMESEKRLEASRVRLFTILENIGDGVVVTSKFGEVEFLNKRAREITGWSNEEAKDLLVEQVLNIIDESSGEPIENPVKQVIGSGVTTNVSSNALLKTRSGNRFLVDNMASPVFDDKDNLTGVVLVFRDVSDKRKAEKELLEGRKFIQKVADSVPSIIYIYNLGTEALTYINYKVRDLLGYAPEELIGVTVSNLDRYINSDDIAVIRSKIIKHKNDPDKPKIYEYRIRDSKGEYRWFRSYEVVFTRGRSGEPIEILGSAFDITQYKAYENELLSYRQNLERLVRIRTSELENTNKRLLAEISIREKAEKGIKEAEEKFRSLVENAPVGIYIFQNNSIVYANPLYCEIFGYSSTEIIGRGFELVISHQDIVTLKSQFEMLVKKNAGNMEKPFKALKKNGDVVDIELIGVPISYKGETAIIGTVIDVTERNKLIEDIRNATERYDLIVESSNSIVYDYDVLTGKILWGGTVFKVLGYSKDEFSGGIKQWESLIHPDEREEAIRLLQEAEDSGKAYDVEYRFRKKNGEYIWFYDRGFFIYNNEGKAIRMLGMMQDITQRKEFEAEIKRERNLFIGGPVVLFRWKRAEGLPVEYVSANVIQFGYTQEDFTSGRISYASIIHPDDINRIVGEVEYYTKNDYKNYEQFYRIRKSDGSYIHLYDFTVTVRDEGGIITHYDGYVFDITELKNTENELNRQKDFLRKIIDTDPNFIFVKDWEGKFTLVNKSVADVYGTTIENLVGKTDADFNPKKDEVKRFLEDDREVMSKGIPKLIPEEPVTNVRTGETRWYQTIKVPLFVDDNKQVLGISTDITARKLAEEITLKSLKDKEKLIREIHHRVKNSLQIIISLLKLQSRYIYDERDAGLFAYSKSRVETLALVHEKLYRKSDLFNIDMRNYLNDLLVHRIKSYNMNHIDYELSVSDMFCNIENAVPAGLIVNEIIIHILTKSFPANYPGILKLTVSKETDWIELIITDNGHNISEDFSSDSMSIQLIEALLRQIEGKMFYEYSDGNKFIIKFREVKYTERI